MPSAVMPAGRVAMSAPMSRSSASVTWVAGLAPTSFRLCHAISPFCWICCERINRPQVSSARLVRLTAPLRPVMHRIGALHGPAGFRPRTVRSVRFLLAFVFGLERRLLPRRPEDPNLFRAHVAASSFRHVLFLLSPASRVSNDRFPYCGCHSLPPYPAMEFGRRRMIEIVWPDPVCWTLVNVTRLVFDVTFTPIWG